MCTNAVEAAGGREGHGGKRPWPPGRSWHPAIVQALAVDSSSDPHGLCPAPLATTATATNTTSLLAVTITTTAGSSVKPMSSAGAQMLAPKKA